LHDSLIAKRSLMTLETKGEVENVRFDVIQIIEINAETTNHKHLQVTREIRESKVEYVT
jgi:hypothetical protein